MPNWASQLGETAMGIVRDYASVVGLIYIISAFALLARVQFLRKAGRITPDDLELDSKSGFIWFELLVFAFFYNVRRRTADTLATWLAIVFRLSFVIMMGAFAAVAFA